MFQVEKKFEQHLKERIYKGDNSHFFLSLSLSQPTPTPKKKKKKLLKEGLIVDNILSILHK